MAFLKRIEIDDLKLGMFIQKLEGNWMDHPFWKTQFVLDDPLVLDRIRHSGVSAALIDVERSRDLPSSRAAPGLQSDAPRSVALKRPAPPAGKPNPPERQLPFDWRSTAPQSLASERARIGARLIRWRTALSRFVQELRRGKPVTLGLLTPIVDELHASIRRNPHAFNGLMRVRRENGALYDDLLATCGLMLVLASAWPHSEEDIRDAGMAGLLMNVGMGHLPIDVSSIGGPLSDRERQIVRSHAQLGHDVLAMGGGLPERVVLTCLQHHERIDGSGYPHGLDGPGITLFGRMAAVCDVYNSLTSDRPHRPAIDPALALEKMRGMDRLFDPEIVEKLVDRLGIYPVGSLIRLASGWLALVVDQNAGSPMRPKVWAFFDTATGHLEKARFVDLSEPFADDEILGSADPARHGIKDLPKLREMLFSVACKSQRST